MQVSDFDIVCIRHAQSNFNKGGLKYVNQYKLYDKDWLDLVQDHQFNKAVTYNPIYIDPHLTQHGIQQCHSAKKLFNPQQVDLIIVSPQLRALQTCQHIFGLQNPNVVVHPLATQVVRYSCDVSHVMGEKIPLFPKYNFEQMKNWTDEWYFEVLSEKKRQICRQYFNKNNITDFKGRQLAIIQLLSKQVISQSAQQLRERVNKLKDLIVQLKNKYKANKIAVVSHHYTTQCLLSPNFDQNGNVVGIGEIINGKPYFRKLQNLLLVR